MGLDRRSLSPPSFPLPVILFTTGPHLLLNTEKIQILQSKFQKGRSDKNMYCLIGKMAFNQ